MKVEGVITIEQADNGWLMRARDDEGLEFVLVSQWDEFDDRVDAWAEMLWMVDEVIGPTTSRYDEKRLKITIEPGDKFEGSTNVSS